MSKTKNRTRNAPKAGGAVSIEVPICGLDGLPEDGYVQRHVDLQLDHRQAVALKRALIGLQGQQLRNERFVQSSADVVRWLLEQVNRGTG